MNKSHDDFTLAKLKVKKCKHDALTFSLNVLTSGISLLVLINCSLSYFGLCLSAYPTETNNQVKGTK